MKEEQFVAYMERLLSDCMELRGRGQNEYACIANVFRNFENLAKDLNLSRQQVLWVFLRKHLDGILAHINGHTSQRESVHGRIKDAIVYLSLLSGMEAETVDFGSTTPAQVPPAQVPPAQVPPALEADSYHSYPF